MRNLRYRFPLTLRIPVLGAAGWLVLAAPAAALDLVVDDFRPDLSGSPADTARLDPAWGDFLAIGAAERRYVTSPQPVLLCDSVGRNGRAGSTPVVVATADGSFKVAYVAWDIGHQYRAVNDNIHPRANLVTRTVTVGEGYIHRTDGVLIAEAENVPDQFGAVQSPNRPPTYFNFVAEGSRYAAYWGSMDPGAYIRHTTHKQAAAGGSPDGWGRYLFEAAPPNDPVNVAGYGEISAAMLPGTQGTRAVLAYETRIAPGDNVSEIRWEDLEAGTHQKASFSRPGTYAEDYAIAADSAGNTVLLWREGSTLLVTAYDADRAVALPPAMVQAGITYKDAANEHFYRPYAIANTTAGNFLIAYVRAGRAWYRTAAIPHGAQAYALGPETALSGETETANYPSIAVNGSKVLFGWFKRVGAADSLVGALHDRQGAGVAAVPSERRALTRETISFSEVGPGWYFYHYFKAPSLALDGSDNIAVAYDNRFAAKLSTTARFAIFHPTAEFVSRPIDLGSLPAAVPLVPSDSLEYLGIRAPARTSQGQSMEGDVTVAISGDSVFGGAGGGFAEFPVGRRSGIEFLRYRIVPRAIAPDYVQQVRVDSLIVRFNVKPRRPRLDSIRIGDGPRAAFDPLAAYEVLTRKDSVHLDVSGIDVESRPRAMFRLLIDGRVADSVAVDPSAPGTYRTRFSFKPPEDLPNPLPIAVMMRDSSGWWSLPAEFRPSFRNHAPAETLAVVRGRGRDSSGVYLPRTPGAADTVPVAAMDTLVLQLGDTATALVRLGDRNDDTVTLRVLRNGANILDRRAAVRDLQTFRFAADTASPLVDTLTLLAIDKDTAAALSFLLRPNRLPAVDSVWLAAFTDKQGARQAGPFDAVRDFAADSGLQVPHGLPAVLRTGWSDADRTFGDRVRISWTVYSARAACAAGDLACYDRAGYPDADSLSTALALPEEYLAVRATDSSGAFQERRVRLEYPVFDTAGAASFRAALDSLARSLDFVLGSSRTADTIEAELANTGNVPLQVLSVSTAADDRRWLSLKLVWEVPGAPPRKDSLLATGRTDSNAVPAGRSVAVAPGARLTLSIRVSSDSLRGDSVLVDTLVLRTNDLANPYIRIPIRMAYNDLPLLRLSHQGGRPGPSGGHNDAGLPDFLPVRSRLVFAFSEPVRILDPAARFRVYSYLDSLKNPEGHEAIPGQYLYRSKAASPKRTLESDRTPGSDRIFGPAWGPGDSIADTLYFIPAYVRASDSLKVRPRPGSFIHRDVIRIAVANGVTDRAGNALDLRLDKVARAPGTVDTVWSVRVDTGSFRVVSTEPASREEKWDPDRLIRVRFNRSLGLPPPRGGDTLTALSFTRLKGDSNGGVWIRSSARGDRRYDFQFVGLEGGDSTLVLRPRPKLAAFDTVTVRLSGGLADVDGLTLDGNGDGFPSRFYDPADTTDDFAWTFHTKDQEFYVFPNPFRHGDPRHRDKGSITFKNVNSLRGYRPGREIALRIHAMNGDLVYSSRSASRPAAAESWASMDWDLRNNAGNKAGTGVYIYTLVLGGGKVLSKGKVAVIR